MKYITRTVWVLSVISLLNDAASEMLYPIMPIYLESIGFSIVLIGILEGMAEAVAGLSKGYFGKLSDYTARRKPFVQLGYALSAISKPMMGLLPYLGWVFTARSLDRIGKGIRTGARDALLSDEATPQTKGKIFGFHRSMDTIGAVLGPSVALIYLYFYPGRYIQLFILAIIPGILTVFSTFLIKEKKHDKSQKISKVSFFSFLHYWKLSSPEYKKLVIGLLVFALVNSSDIFLLLVAKHAGLNPVELVGLYIFYNLIYALSAFPAGILADKIGLKKIFMIGLGIFAIVYGSIGFCTGIYEFIVMFFLYGIFSATTEGISKAWISNISDKKDTATAIGSFTGFQSIAALIASTLTGLLWKFFGPEAAFIAIAIISIIVVFYILCFVPYRKPVHE